MMKTRFQGTPDEETLRSETHENVIENCPKCGQISAIVGPDYINKSLIS
jgi:hypothetical protein